MTDLHTRLAIALPGDFRHVDVLRFYARDREQVSERTQDQRIEKALHWQGQPALLQLDLGVPDTARAVLKGAEADPAQLQDQLRSMLGLKQDITSLLAYTPGLRMPQNASPFEAACWAVIGQMISVEAAISVRRKLIRQLGTPLANGMICHPLPDQLLAASPDQLSRCGLSASKAATLIRLAGAVESGALPLEHWATLSQPPAEEISAALSQVKGIGPWTQSYILLRGYGALDGSLHGDIVVRKRLGALLNLPEPPDQAFTQQWLSQFAPWRALVAAHLWAMPTDTPTKDY